MSDDDVPIKTGPASQAYLDNWEHVFGEKFEEKCREDTSAVFPIDGDSDAIECRVKLYANFEQPRPNAIFPAMCVCDEPTCDAQPCKDLRELRIAYAVVKRLRADSPHLETVQDVLDEIETECEILCK